MCVCATGAARSPPCPSPLRPLGRAATRSPPCPLDCPLAHAPARARGRSVTLFRRPRRPREPPPSLDLLDLMKQNTVCLDTTRSLLLAAALPSAQMLHGRMGRRQMSMSNVVAPEANVATRHDMP